MKGSTIIGIDIGGTKIGIGVVTPSGKLLKKERVPTGASEGKDAVLSAVTHAVDKLWTKSIKGIGVGIAGLVEPKKGVFLGGPNLPLGMKNLKLAALLSKRYGVPVRVDNDVHCFTLAEAKFGAGKGKKLVVGITFGTGIGGGVVHDGAVLRGKNNALGEIGHTVIDFARAHDYGRGTTGSFESLAAGKAMSSMYAAITASELGHTTVLEPLEVQHAAETGDMHAKKTMTIMSAAMSAGIANLLHTYDPDVIVAGGGLSAVAALWEPVVADARALCRFPELQATPIVRSRLGSDANIIGAALLLSEKR